ncbi:MAG: hypothetical protein Q8918_17730, partial [Bacteroidota bacterium]|nr:hypothetical protein [Bacteroidota bacterium]
MGADRFTLDYSNDTTNRIDKIILNLSGDSLQIRVSGDTLVNYYLRFKQISWSNGPDRKLDVYIEPRGFLCIPADIAFIKRQNKLYFILVSING